MIDDDDEDEDDVEDEDEDEDDGVADCTQWDDAQPEADVFRVRYYCISNILLAVARSQAWSGVRCAVCGVR